MKNVKCPRIKKHRNKKAIPASCAVTAPLTKHSALVAFRQILHRPHLSQAFFFTEKQV